MVKNVLFLLVLSLVTLRVSAQEVLMFGGDIEVEPVDIDALLADGPAKAQKDVLKNKPQMLLLLRQIYLMRALAAEAEKQGLAEDALIQAKLRRQRERLLYLERLQQLDEQPLPDFAQAAKEQYLGNSDTYTIPEKVKAQHILIATTDRMPKYHPKEEALELARKVKAEVDTGRSFDDLVAEFSEDVVTKKNKGSLGFFTQGSMVDPVDKAVFAMHEPGQVSDIVESQFGYHIIKLNNRYPARKQSFEQVKDDIMERLKKDFIEKRRQIYFDELLQRNDAKIYEDLLENYMEERLQALDAKQK